MGVPVDLAGAATLLDGAADVVVCAHVYPDADAIGSAVALASLLRHRGVRVRTCHGGTGPVPETLLSIPGAADVRPATEVLADVRGGDGADLLVAVDCASAGRLGSGRALLDEIPRGLVLDHHGSNEGFGTAHLVDTNAESTTVLVLRLADYWGIEPDHDLAHAVYAGLMMDTGSFRWVRPGTHLLAERLLAHGPDAGAIARELADAHPVEWLHLLGRVLSDARLDLAACAGGLVSVTVPHALVSSVRPEDVEAVVDLVRTVREADVAAVLKELQPGVWSVSLRSHGTVDVGAVAVPVGGGGHARAAGFTVCGDADGARAALLRALAG